MSESQIKAQNTTDVQLDRSESRTYGHVFVYKGNNRVTMKSCKKLLLYRRVYSNTWTKLGERNAIITRNFPFHAYKKSTRQ
jgi:hypothetical protein